MIDRGKLKVTNIEDYKRRIRQTKPDAVFTDRWLSIRELCEKVRYEPLHLLPQT